MNTSKNFGRTTGRKKFLCGICIALLAVLLSACGNRSPKFKQYYIGGERLYEKHCSNCHQTDGRGLGKLYPPVDRSDYMRDSLNAVVCLIRYGKIGSLTVNGVEYNQPMPGIATLSDLEIAQIVTYIYNAWSHERGLIDVRETSRILNSCGQDEKQ